jgi:cobalt-zinc-cadmium efflux system outer membrane protein
MIRVRGFWLLLFWLVLAAGVAVSGAGEPTPSAPAPPVLTLDAAVRWALARNPELDALRLQHGIAVGALVTAETYPFNPTLESKLRAASGPPAAGVTNHFNQEHRVFMDVEIRGQGKYRRSTAEAALTRTDWEIAFLETSLAVRVVRAFDTLIYRYEKLRLVEDTVQLNAKSLQDLSRLVAQAAGSVGLSDLIVARTELEDVRAQLGPARTAVAVAWGDLRRLLGLVEEVPELHGSLVSAERPWDILTLTQDALQTRPDLHARRAAVAEAEARLRLTVADRFGNPSLGPDYEFDPSRITFIGAQISLPLPVLNTRKGEILQREAERTRAILEERQIETQIRQDVNAALARLNAARAWAQTYRTTVLPNLQTSQKEIEGLFAQREKGLDILKVIDVRRKVLKARDAYLDALFEVRQASADLGAAVGDVTLTFSPP